MKHTAQEIKDWDVLCKTEEGGWVPCRPLNYKYESKLSRLKWAWGVLIGKYDVVEWTES